jgi:K+-transporting ATPase A subunit
MNLFNWLQLTIYLVTLILLAKPLGTYMERVYQGERVFLDRVLGPVEQFIYRISGIDPKTEMDWKVYAVSMLLFNLTSSKHFSELAGADVTPAIHLPEAILCMDEALCKEQVV